MLQHDHPIAMAGTAQKMLRILAFTCPPNYTCGGPAYAAGAGVDAILHIMGIGMAILRLQTASPERVAAYQDAMRQDAISGEGILPTFTQHKSQILSGALHCVLSDNRRGEFRESPEATESAMLSIMEWYLKKSKTTPEAFFAKLKEGGHDEVIQLEKAEEAETRGEKSPGPSSGDAGEVGGQDFPEVDEDLEDHSFGEGASGASEGEDDPQ